MKTERVENWQQVYNGECVSLLVSSRQFLYCEVLCIRITE